MRAGRSCRQNGQERRRWRNKQAEDEAKVFSFVVVMARSFHAVCRLQRGSAYMYKQGFSIAVSMNAIPPVGTFSPFCNLFETMSPFSRKKKAGTPADDQSASSASALVSSRSGHYGLPDSSSQSGYEHTTNHDLTNTTLTTSATESKSGMTSNLDV